MVVELEKLLDGLEPGMPEWSHLSQSPSGRILNNGLLDQRNSESHTFRGFAALAAGGKRLREGKHRLAVLNGAKFVICHIFKRACCTKGSSYFGSIARLKLGILRSVSIGSLRVYGETRTAGPVK